VRRLSSRGSHETSWRAACGTALAALPKTGAYAYQPTQWRCNVRMGSRTFQAMASFWPTPTEVFAPPMNQIPKAVFSKQGAPVLEAAAATLRNTQDQASDTRTGPLQPGAESWAEAYVASGDLAREITRLKAEDGKPIVAHGGAAFARSLIARNLVDEYVLLVYPIALGKGLSIFSDLPEPRPLELVRSKTFPLGAVAQTYRPA
jgi:dihydrofolate reductase